MYAVREPSGHNVFVRLRYDCVLTHELGHVARLFSVMVCSPNSSPKFTCRRRPSLRRRLGVWNLTSFTARRCSTPPASALSLVRDSQSIRAPSFSSHSLYQHVASS